MAENIENNGCSQRDNAEHEGYVKASRSFNRIWKERDSAQPRLLETILYKDNFNRAYKRVKANKGAPGIDGMTIEEALPYLKEHQQEITDRIYRGKYTPSPVRRVEIPKPDGGVRKLGIPTVIDRTLQQAITQQLVPIYEPLFADGSYGYRPNRSAKDAILKVKEYAEQGYTFAVVLDLSKYFDTLNHEILINLLRKNVKDERVVQLIKRYLKSGVMENGVVIDTEEGSPQGGLCRARHKFPCGIPTSVLSNTPLLITPALRYLWMSEMTLPSLMVRDNTSMSLLWHTVSKNFSKSISTTYP